MKYPSQAKRMGVEGKVYVQFLIEEDGGFSEIKVIRGIGAGCDEEAERVIKSAPNWKPDKVKGKTVKQMFVLPLSFRLG